MYRILTVSDTVRVPPSYFTMDLNSAVQKLIQDKYERRVDMENGVVLKVWNVHDVTGGKVVPETARHTTMSSTTLSHSYRKCTKS